MNCIPGKARIVIIGGGIGGSSAAYHLAALGQTDVVLLERSMLSSGTTWHSTGNMETYRADPLIYDMVRYAAETYPRLARETDKDIGWRPVGRVHYTDREDRWALMRDLPELGRARGMVLEPMTPAQVQARLPIIDSAGLAGGLWIPSDARVNATDAVHAFAAAARARGVRICQDAVVERIAVRHGAVCGVECASGRIDCDIVVLAAGLWSRDLAAGCGVHLPMYALEHQYIITKPQGMPRNLPLFLSYDDQLYGREEVGGLMIGSLDDDAIPLSAAQLPQNFSFALLNERWPQFEAYMDTAMRRFPLLRNAEIKMLLNGPESFTHDGQMLLGPAPGLTGLFMTCAFNSNGMALAPAAGRYVAEWIVEGAPSADVAPLDARRFSPAQATEDFMRARAAEIPGFHCRMHGPGDDYRSARNLRLSPLHAQLRRAGAHFTSINGWERPAWIAHDAGGFAEFVAREVRAASEAVLMVDRSSDVKILCAGHLPAAGATGLEALVGSQGQVEAVVRRIAWQNGQHLLTASPDQETWLLEWQRREAAQPLNDLSASLAMIELHGPARHRLLADLGAAGLAVHTLADDTADSALLLISSELADTLWQHLLDRGTRHGLLVGGHLAQEALRVRRGLPGFGAEATPARLATELGFDAVPPPTVPAPRTHQPRRLVALSSSMPRIEFGSREIALGGEAVVGELCSRVRLPGWPETLALALIDPNRWDGASSLHTVAAGRRWPLAPRHTLWSSRVAAGGR
ncbi:MAG: GcvT family protein [Proteobacteria bacterium]|nr:GcvT family protein [Pseudomonadota bacterium]